MMQKLICTVLIILILIPSLVLAQDSNSSTTNRDAKVSRLIGEAQQHFERGEAAYRKQDFETARLEFDLAVDILLKAGLDIRAYPSLRAYFSSLIQKINSLEVQAVANGEELNEQTYEPSLFDQLADIDLDKEDLAAGEQSMDEPSLDFSFTLTPQVRQFIHYFSQNQKGRATMAAGLQRAGRYLQLARQIFREEGVPLDLVWLAQAESNWRPRARSFASAVGIWQFIPSTGMRYGLRQNEWIDERSSFEQATRASASYLKFLYNRFLDWQLAMAGYNCGENRVDRAIAATGFADFWYIYNRGLLPKETRNYVPIILAIIIIAQNPEKYGFGHVKPELPLRYDTVTVADPIDLRLVAEITNTPYEEVLELNPELKRGVTPPNMNYNLRLPQGSETLFTTLLGRIPEDARDSWRVIRVKAGDTLQTLAEQYQLEVAQVAQINNYDTGMFLKPGTPLVLPIDEARNSIRGRVDSDSVQIARRSTRRTSIHVRPGDTLTRIAARYGVSAQELARVNKISSKAKLRAGQQLYLNLPSTKTSHPSSQSQRKSSPTTYRVKRGDTLTEIGQRFGVSVADLQAWNGLKSGKVLVGQQLRLTPQSKAKIGRTSSKKVTHRVRRGDTLSGISRRYGVSVQQLKVWNGLKSGKILAGQQLVVSR